MSKVEFMRRYLLGLGEYVLWASLLLAPVSGAMAQANPAVERAESGRDAQRVHLSLKDMGLKQPLRLVGADTQSTIDFSFHTVDVVDHLRLKLHYSYSPTLNAESSRLKVAVNGNEIGILQLPKSDAKVALAVLEIDPIYLQEWNHLSFQFLAHQIKPLCDDPRSQSDWIQIDIDDSYLEGDAKQLSLINDLTIFPAPFFDQHDARDISLPMVFTAQPSWAALKAGGILASWFGSLADYRKVRFPSYLDSIPDGNAIVLATQDDKITGIELPRVSAGVANVSMINNPNNPATKLLLVVGRDEQGLIAAAQALALGQVPLMNAQQNVTSAVLTQRVPYDAPGWLQTEKRIRLGDLVEPEKLKAKALFLTEHEFVLRLPPNIYRSDADSIPFDLAFDSSNNSRYLSRIDAYFNGKSFQFATFPKPKAVGPNMLPDHVMLRIPTRELTGQDTIKVKFTFSEREVAFCNEKLEWDEIRIDPNSRIDLGGMTRYMELPDLSYLAYTGYPFSKLADLSESVVLLPETPDAGEVASMLTMLGHIGHKTRYPAVAVSIASLADADKFSGKDILLVGATEKLRNVLGKWSGAVPVDLYSEHQPFPYLGSRYLSRWWNWAEEAARLNRAKGQQGMIFAGFESPLQPARSVVILTAAHSDHLLEAASALNTFRYAKDFAGDVVVIGETDMDGRAVAFHQARRFAVGDLPLKDWLKNFMNNNPWLAVLLVMLAALFFGSMMHLKMRQTAQERIGPTE